MKENRRTKSKKPAVVLWVFFILLELICPCQTSYAQATPAAAIPITIDLDGYRLSAITSRPTVEQALLELQIRYNSSSIVIPNPTSLVNPNLTIYVKNQTPYVLQVDGQQISAQSFPTTIATILTKHEIDLGPLDTVTPSFDHIILPNEQIIITRFAEEMQKIHEPLAFDTIYQEDASLYVGEQQTVQQGENGELEVEIKQIFKDGKLLSEERINETVIKEPVAAIVNRGIKSRPPEPTLNPAPNNSEQLHCGKATWYRSSHGPLSASSRDYSVGTNLKITSQNTGRSIIVTVQGWGPQEWTGAIIDLSPDAFEALDRHLYYDGTDQVCIEPV